MRGKILEGEHFGQSSLMKQMVWNILTIYWEVFSYVVATLYLHRIGEEN